MTWLFNSLLFQKLAQEDEVVCFRHFKKNCLYEQQTFQLILSKYPLKKRGLNYTVYFQDSLLKPTLWLCLPILNQTVSHAKSVSGPFLPLPNSLLWLRDPLMIRFSKPHKYPDFVFLPKLSCILIVFTGNRWEGGAWSWARGTQSPPSSIPD